MEHASADCTELTTSWVGGMLEHSYTKSQTYMLVWVACVCRPHMAMPVTWPGGLHQRPRAYARLTRGVPAGNGSMVDQRPVQRVINQYPPRMREVREVAPAERAVRRSREVAVDDDIHGTPLREFARHTMRVRVPVNPWNVFQQRRIEERAGSILEVDRVPRPQRDVPNRGRRARVSSALASKHEVARQQRVEVRCADVVQQPTWRVGGVTGCLADDCCGVEPEGQVVHPGHKVAAVQPCMHDTHAHTIPSVLTHTQPADSKDGEVLRSDWQLLCRVGLLPV